MPKSKSKSEAGPPIEALAPDIPRLHLREVNLTDPVSYKEVHVKPEVVPQTEQVSRVFSLKTFIPYLGPCALMTIGFLDPGNLEADLQTGAYTGYTLLWVLVPVHLFSLGLHLLGAHLTISGGYNLAETCRREYSKHICVVLWLMAEVTIVVADVQAVVGSAMGFRVLTNMPLWQGALLSAFDTFVLLLLYLLGVRKLEALLITFMLVVVFCAVAVFVAAQPDLLDVSFGFVPTAPREDYYQIVALYSATIVPAANIFFFSALVQTRRVDRTSPVGVSQARKYFFVGASLAMFVAFMTNALVTATSATFFNTPQCGEGKGAIANSCVEIGLENASENMPLSEEWKYVWAIGVIICGQWSTITETWAGQLIMEGFFRWKLSAFSRVMLTRAISLVPATLICLFLTSGESLGHIDNWLNVVQALMLAFVVYALLEFTSSRRIMGRHAIGPVLRMLTWMVLLITSGATFGLILIDFLDEDSWTKWLAFGVVGVYAIALVGLIARDIRTLLVTRCGKRRTTSCSSTPFLNSQSDEVERVGFSSDDDDGEDSSSSIGSRTFSGPSVSVFSANQRDSTNAGPT